MFLTRRERYHRINYELKDKIFGSQQNFRIWSENMERTIDLLGRYNFHTYLCDD